MSKNLMPEVAKELEKINGCIALLTNLKHERTAPATSIEYTIDALECKKRELLIPRYTIPEDLPVDSKVWVRDYKCDEWRPRHFAELNKDAQTKDRYAYRTWYNGSTSFSISKTNKDVYSIWRFCITDEEYQKRKKEGTL